MAEGDSPFSALHQADFHGESMIATAVPGFQTQTIVDLKAVQAARRHATWCDTVPNVFPGLTLEQCRKPASRGSIQHMRFAESHAWVIESAPVEVVYCPDGERVNADFISVMLQLEGTTEVSQGARKCRLNAGDFCFLDNRQEFFMDVPANHSRFVAWQLPRDYVLKCHPLIGRHTAVCFDANELSGGMLQQSMLQTLHASSFLGPNQQRVALCSFVQLMGILSLPEQPAQKSSHWRLTRALAVIEERFIDSQFGAQTVADEQRISRRQLDRMFLEEIGCTVTARIWDRRLACAAELLKDPLHLPRSITEIALSSGFEDAAHFTRAFKKAYRCTPRMWRCKHCIHAKG